MYILNVNYSGVYGALDGVENILNLTGLNVTSYYSNGTVNTAYNASIQQNFFVANSLGAPVYWIQNVIYINGSQKTGWFMDYTGWVIYPFYGLYPNATVYEYNFPAGKFVSLPHTFVIKTWISNLTLPMDQIMNFQVNSQILQIPVPGASFIIGSYNYSYLWQGNVYTNGPYPSNANPGGLSPQFGLVGGPSAGIGYFEPPTSGYMEPYILPLGLKKYISPITYTFTTSNDQTGEIAQNLNWVDQNGVWYLSTLSGDNVQGVISVEPYEPLYNVTFVENGLPPGTNWSVTLNGTTLSSTSNAITFTEPNGTYSYYIGSVSGYTVSPSSGSITVNGKNIKQNITFMPVKVVSNYTVTFTESGLSSETLWSVTLNGTTESSIKDTITFKVPNGTYSYSIGSISGYTVSPQSGTVTVKDANVSVSITFTQIKYSIIFKENGLPSGTLWFIKLNGTTHNSTTNTITITEPNGSYSYTIETPISGGTGIQYVLSQSTGTLTVNGADININVPYTTQYYLTMIASPSNGGTVSPSSGWYNAGSSVTIDAISNSNFEFVSWSGTGNGSYSGTNNPVSITINGPIRETANFIELYKITFMETGLPPGTMWYVNLSNGQSYNTTGNSIEIKIPNGPYSYMIATTNKEYSAQGGPLIVNGANMEISIKFNLVTYAITFTESGLSSGTSWSVTLNNIEKSSTNGTITFNEPNGTYSYIISGISGYRANTYSGTINVNGNPVSVSINWTVITLSLIHI